MKQQPNWNALNQKLTIGRGEDKVIPGSNYSHSWKRWYTVRVCVLVFNLRPLGSFLWRRLSTRWTDSALTPSQLCATLVLKAPQWPSASMIAATLLALAPPPGVSSTLLPLLSPFFVSPWYQVVCSRPTDANRPCSSEPLTRIDLHFDLLGLSFVGRKNCILRSTMSSDFKCEY